MKSFLELKEKIQKGKDDPCWKDYVQLGTKKKNGKEVPNCVPKESAIQEKAVSQSQQKMMGMALAYKRGEMDDASPEVKKMANSASTKDLQDFAKTKHKGLPVKKESVELEENQKLFMFKTKQEAEKKAKEVKGKVVSLTKQNFAVVAEEVELDETITPKHVKMAIGVASDKRYAGGNMTGAVNAIEKIKKGLSDHPQVKAVLRRQNESLDEAGYRVPSNYTTLMLKKRKQQQKAAAKEKWGKDDAEYLKKNTQKEEVEQVDEAGSPERPVIIKRATQQVKDKKAPFKAAVRSQRDRAVRAALRDIRTEGAQRGTAPLKKDLDEAGSPERLAIIKRAAQRVKDKRDAARAADKKASFKAAVRDMQTKGAQRGMAPLKRDLDEGRNDARKALMGLAKQGGIDKATFQKAYDLYSDTKFVELKKLIAGADTDPREAILDVINRHDSRAFNSMYPRGLSKGGLTKESTDLDEKSRSFPFQGSNDHAPKNIFQPPFGSRKNMGQVTFLDKSGKEYSPTSSKNKKKVKEESELDEAFKKGDSVTVKNARKYDALSKPEVSGTVIGMIGSKVMVKVASGQSDRNNLEYSGQMNVDPKDLVKESAELGEAKGAGVKKFVRGMRVQNLNGSKGTVIKGGDNLKKAVEVEWDNGQTTLASAKYLKSMKKNESVELDEAKISVGDRVTLQPNKNTLDRSLIGKAGVVTGMVGSKPTVKFANGKTIAVSPNDLKINESVEHENCGTPDCCGTCDTDIKEMNFFKFRNRLDSTRD